MAVGSTGSSTEPKLVQPGAHDPFAAVDIEAFLKLMITELQNQDPLNPMDNNEILEQINQIQNIQSNKKLVDTLDSVLLGQNLASASALIGQEIHALTDGGDDVTGRVERVSIEDGVPHLIVGGESIQLKNLREIIAPEELTLNDIPIEWFE